MNVKSIAVLCSLAVVAGCANEPRSRDIGNPSVSGETLAFQVCSNCHGATGVSVSPNFPNLAAQQAPYLVAQLTAFRAKSRSDPPGPEYMWGLARHLTDKQIGEIAAHYANLPPANTLPEGDANAITQGRAIFQTGISANGVPPCSSCHGVNGQGNAVIPRIAGQHMAYVQRQLSVFQLTDARPQGAAMKTVAHGLSKADMSAVAAFVQSLPNDRGDARQ